MLNAVLLDLDNTMVIFDEPLFYQRYFEALGAYFSDVIPPEELVERILHASLALAKNDGRLRNRCFFMEALEKGAPKMPHLWERFMGFYQTRFDEIPVMPVAPEGLHPVVSGLQNAGLKLVLATNPIWPEMVVEKRMAWVGLDRRAFALVTHMENMSFVKPHLGYYRQICEMIQVPPENCMMVGNDPVNDMAASGVGMRTYLTTDTTPVDYSTLQLNIDLPDRDSKTPEPDARGPFANVPDEVERLLAE